MIKTLDKNQTSKILTPNVRKILNCLNKEGESRVVGGAVRDVLRGRDVGDCDIATLLAPERVGELLAKQNIKVVPTGLAHGTVTAILDHKGYEITTLRRDVKTDGRHAEVVFTDDWQSDAMRRDFTMNALYVDESGTLYDYGNGIEDALEGRILFIGDPEQRIKEDILRILRFFRFFAQFGKGEIDPKGLAACKKCAAEIKRLSQERVRHEVLKLLSAPDPRESWRLMTENKIVSYVIATAVDHEKLGVLIGNEQRYDIEPFPLARLAALLPSSEKEATRASERLKLSHKEAELLQGIIKLEPMLDLQKEPHFLRKSLYAQGVLPLKLALLLQKRDIKRDLDVIAAWDNPLFPLRGEDLLRLGHHPGPELGHLLKEIEMWWIDNDFKPGHAACLARAKT